jgi:hypothetical protein
MHASRQRYTWEWASHPDDLPLAPVPDWLLALVRHTAQPDPRAAVTLPDALPVVDLDSLQVSPRMRRVILTGNDAHHPYLSRSEAAYAVMQAMILAGYDDATIAAVLLDARYGISERQLEKRNPRSPNYWPLTRGYVAGEIARARAKVPRPDASTPRRVPLDQADAQAEAPRQRTGHLRVPVTSAEAAVLGVHDDGLLAPALSTQAAAAPTAAAQPFALRQHLTTVQTTLRRISR